MTTISVLVEITQEDFTEAQKMWDSRDESTSSCVCEYCPVARAICRATGRSDWHVYERRCSDMRNLQRNSYDLPPAAVAAVKAFDCNQSVQLPATFHFTYEA